MKLIAKAVRPIAKENSLTELMPTDELMAGAWVSALLVASKHPAMMAHFEADTGIRWKPARSLDRMVDEATGAELNFVLAFVRWFNANVWGEKDGRATNGDEP